MKILNSKIHYFNPGHESAVLADNPYYTPPASVCKIMADLALLPAWYGKENDCVIINETTEASRFLLSLPQEIRPSVIPVAPFVGTHLQSIVGVDLQSAPLHAPFVDVDLQSASFQFLEAAPWGLSPHSIRVFETLINSTNLKSLKPLTPQSILIPTWNKTHKTLTSRQTALTCLSTIRSLLPEHFERLTLPRFCSSIAEIKQFMTDHPPPYLLKTPYSCSGRGLFRLQSRDLDLQASRWIEGAINKQGIVSIEQALDKVLDFAMEFVSDGEGHIRFEGLAVFSTLSKGAYAGNLLGRQDQLERHLTTFIPASHLREIQETVTSVLTEVFSHDYRGYIGVDMLIYRHNHNFAIHPCIEINVRYTMGLVALQISDKWVHPSSHGQLIINCHRVANKTCNEHLRMKTKYPLQLSGSKIRSGYLSLCPISSETQYHAYMLIEKDDEHENLR